MNAGTQPLIYRSSTVCYKRRGRGGAGTYVLFIGRSAETIREVMGAGKGFRLSRKTNRKQTMNETTDEHRAARPQPQNPYHRRDAEIAEDESKKSDLQVTRGFVDT